MSDNTRTGERRISVRFEVEGEYTAWTDMLDKSNEDMRSVLQSALEDYFGTEFSDAKTDAEFVDDWSLDIHVSVVDA